MPNFQFAASNNTSVYRWDAFDNYNLIKTSATSWRLVWDEAENGPLDPESSAAELRLTIEDGEITRIRYFAEDGTLLANMGGLSMNAGFFAWAVDDDGLNGNAIFDLLSQGGLAITGGAQSNNAEFSDDITTSAFRDTVNALSGNDYIKDRGGADIYNGGSGFDMVTYNEWQCTGATITQGIIADLAAGTAKGPDGKIDTLTGIEGIRGTHLVDTIRGSSRDENFRGDRGADVIDGRGGFDSVEYWDRDRGPGVTVNLRTGVAVDQFGTKDRLSNIEGVWGSGQADVLIDNGSRNQLGGEEGNDRLVFKGGDDWGRGGMGADRFIFQGTNFGDEFIDDFNPEEGDRIRIEAAANFDSLNVSTEDEGIRINLNAESSVFLWDYFGDVEPYLIFA